MHKVQVKSILSPKNNMNLYRGCTHGCIYCDSRSTCYHMDHAFEDVEVKENSLDLLEIALMKRKQKGMIGCGSMSDPYMPLEQELHFTSSAMKLALKYKFGFTFITKSTRFLQDIEILRQLRDQTRIVVQMTLTTYDEALCRKLEPHVSTTKERFEALMRLQAENIPTIVWLCPILPFINDSEENLRGILSYCVQAKVKGILCFDMGLTLREGNREYFYQQLDTLFPGLKEKYIRVYGSSYGLESPNNDKLMRIFHQTCEQNQIMHNVEQIFDYLQEYKAKEFIEQYQLF